MVTPCCGYSLRKATIMVATIEIIFASVSAVFYILGLTAIGPSSMSSVDLRSIQPNFRIPFVDVRDASDEAIVAALTGIFAVALVSCILVIAFSTFLLLNLQRTGTSRNVKVWLGYKAVMIILAAGYILTVTISGYSTVAGTISDLVSLAMHLYFFWVVWSYWKQLLDEKALSMTPNITQIQGNIEVSFPL